MVCSYGLAGSQTVCPPIPGGLMGAQHDVDAWGLVLDGGEALAMEARAAESHDSEVAR